VKPCTHLCYLHVLGLHYVIVRGLALVHDILRLSQCPAETGDLLSLSPAGVSRAQSG
jgi:hypothetical protein